MHSKRLFLQWSLTVSLIAVGSVIVAVLGGFDLAWSLDGTKISFLIMGLFVVASGYCGVLAWRIDVALDTKRLQDLAASSGTSVSARRPLKFGAFLKETANQAEHGWLAIGWCEKLGLLGTVIGFIMMLIHGFHGFAPTNQADIQHLLDRLSYGMSTAFVTTLVGIVCGMLLELQFHMLDRSLERLRP